MKTPRREIVLPRGVYIVGAILISGYVMYWLRGILTPILLAFVIAYVLDPIVDQLEAWRVPRVAAIAIVLAMVLGVLVLFLALVLPSIATEVAGVIQELPRQLANLWARIGPWLEQRGVAIPHSTTELIDQLSGYVSTVASSILAPASNVLTTLMGGTVSVIGSVFAAVVVLVLAVYLLNDFDRLIAGIRELIPLRWRATVTNYAEEINHILSHFLRGQLTVMAILAVLYGGAYALLGVRLAVPIGIAAGILNFIPYLGGAFALIAGVLMSLLDGWHTGQLVGVVLAYTVVHTLEGFVITPRIIGKTVGLSEIWVLVALFVGGEIFGFLGVLLAVPVAAVAKIFVAHAVKYYRTTELYLQDPPTSLSEQTLTSHEGLVNASHAEPGRELPTTPESERRQF